MYLQHRTEQEQARGPDTKKQKLEMMMQLPQQPRGGWATQSTLLGGGGGDLSTEKEAGAGATAAGAEYPILMFLCFQGFPHCIFPPYLS